ncbi:glycosyltransferase [soil metagenome]
MRGSAPALALLLAVATALITLVTALGPRRTLTALHLGLFLLFATVSSWRLMLPLLAPRRRSRALQGLSEWPAYTIIVPLRDEAAMAAQILNGLRALDYPADRLDALLVVEADDIATRDALIAARLPPFARVLVAPPGGPTTKPRACNLALREATGELVVVYDAEDEPDPGQLREAAARFAKAPARLACLQAPLRIHPREDFIGRQFALEYAALFEVVLPALARMGLPFPLGGTSNHFRRSALDAVGGWDAFNVTEDADIGFRLAAEGFTAGVLRSPTFESAPDTLESWLPQRTRWLKGYVQTWSTAMRAPRRGGLRRFLALQTTLGLSIVTGVLHGPLVLVAVAAGLVALTDLNASAVFWADLVLVGFSWVSAAALMAEGADRAGFARRPRDLIAAVAYWPIQSLAAAFAVHQLFVSPFRWDKTPHRPRITAPVEALPALDPVAPFGVTIPGERRRRPDLRKRPRAAARA